jgi:hypothetical protein
MVAVRPLIEIVSASDFYAWVLLLLYTKHKSIIFCR